MTSHITKYGMGTIFLRGGTYWIQYFSNGERIRESAKTSDEKEARRFLQRRLGEMATGAHAGMASERATVADILDLALASYRMKERRSTAALESQLNHVRPALGKIRTAALSTADIERYVRRRLAEQPRPSNASINRELAALRHGLKLGARRSPPLVARPIHIDMLPENNARKGFLEHADYERLRNCLPAFLRPLFVVAYHVGARVGELKAIKWDQVDIANETIVLHETKNDSPRSLPIYGEMGAWLEMAKADRDVNFPECQYVFSKKGKRIGDFRKTWEAACELAGVSILFHDTRRTAARNMERAGVPRTVAMAITGHKTESMYRRYAGIVSTRDLKDAGNKISRHLEQDRHKIATTTKERRS